MVYLFRNFNDFFYSPGVHPIRAGATAEEIFENLLTDAEVTSVVAHFVGNGTLQQVPAGAIVTCCSPAAPQLLPGLVYPALENDGTFNDRPLYGSQQPYSTQLWTTGELTTVLRDRWVAQLGLDPADLPWKSVTQLNLLRNRIMWRYYHPGSLIPMGFEVSHMAEAAHQNPLFNSDASWLVIELVGLESREMNESRKLCREWGLWITDVDGSIIQNDNRHATCSRCPHAAVGRPCFGSGNLSQNFLDPPTYLTPGRLATVRGRKKRKALEA